jgi:TPR repeat protein
MATFYFVYSHSNQDNELVYIVDDVSGSSGYSLNGRTNIGNVYRTEKKQYDKALAWYILAAMENNSIARNNIGDLYFDGLGVPKNYLCALKCYLKAAEQSTESIISYRIGKLL